MSTPSFSFSSSLHLSPSSLLRSLPPSPTLAPSSLGAASSAFTLVHPPSAAPSSPPLTPGSGSSSSAFLPSVSLSPPSLSFSSFPSSSSSSSSSVPSFSPLTASSVRPSAPVVSVSLPPVVLPPHLQTAVTRARFPAPTPAASSSVFTSSSFYPATPLHPSFAAAPLSNSPPPPPAVQPLGPATAAPAVLPSAPAAAASSLSLSPSSSSSLGLGAAISVPPPPPPAAAVDPLGTAAATVIPLTDSTVSAAAMLMSISSTGASTASTRAGSSSSSAAATVPASATAASSAADAVGSGAVADSTASSSSSSSSSAGAASRSSLMSSLSNPTPRPKPLPPVSALERFVHYLHPLLQSHPGSVAPSITLPQLRVIAQTNFHQLIALSLSVHFNPRRPYAGHTGKEEKLIICKNGWNALRNYISSEREKVWRAEMVGLSVREQRVYKKRRKEEKKVANAAIREGRMAKFIDIANEYAINYAAFVKLGDEHSGRLRFRQIKKEQKDAAANALVNSSALISASNVNAAIISAMPTSVQASYPTTLAHAVDERPPFSISGLDMAALGVGPYASSASASSSSSSSSSASSVPSLSLSLSLPPFLPLPGSSFSSPSALSAGAADATAAAGNGSGLRIGQLEPAGFEQKELTAGFAARLAAADDAAYAEARKRRREEEEQKQTAAAAADGEHGGSDSSGSKRSKTELHDGLEFDAALAAAEDFSGSQLRAN